MNQILVLAGFFFFSSFILSCSLKISKSSLSSKLWILWLFFLLKVRIFHGLLMTFSLLLPKPSLLPVTVVDLVPASTGTCHPSSYLPSLLQHTLMYCFRLLLKVFCNSLFLLYCSFAKTFPKILKIPVPSWRHNLYFPNLLSHHYSTMFPIARCR